MLEALTTEEAEPFVDPETGEEGPPGWDDDNDAWLAQVGLSELIEDG